MFAEVELRCGLKSVHALAKKNLVCVHGEDLLLGEAPLDLDREYGLLNLASIVLIGRQKEVARELHRERRGPLHASTGTEIAISRAHPPPYIHSRVTLEILILDRDHSVAQNLGDIVIADDHAALQGKRSNLAAVIVVELGNGTRTIALELTDLRQIGGRDKQQPGERAYDSGSQREQKESHTSWGRFTRRRSFVLE